MRLLILILICNYTFAQTFGGKVIDKKNNEPVQFVNIGIPGKNIGTTSDEKGQFTITVTDQNDDDVLLFSCIGYEPYSVKIKTLKEAASKDIFLTEKIVNLKEVVVKPKLFKEKTVGITTQTKTAEAGFEKNKLGYEMGVLMSVKKKAELERININIAECSYDSIFYRLNIYQMNENKEFVNILTHPIYIKRSKAQVADKITIDLSNENIEVSGDFLVSLEHIKDLGEGRLYLSCKLFNKTYFRETSQGSWQTVAIGVSISADVKIEQ